MALLDHTGQEGITREIWVVSAFLPEQDVVRLHDGTVISLENTGFTLRFHLIGVGNIAAADSLRGLLATARDTCAEILFLGSAGAYVSGSRGFVLAHSFGQKELAVLEGRAVQPGAMPTLFETAQGPLARALAQGSDLAPGKVNCPGALSLVDPGDVSWTHENLECAGLAYVASSMQLPFAALLAVTNAVGPQGSKEWQANHKEMGRTLQLRLKKTILEHKKSQ